MNTLIEHLRDPAVRVRLAIYQLISYLIAWPTTSLTIFKDEPQGVLGLSWWALIMTQVGIIITTDVRKQQEEDEE